MNRDEALRILGLSEDATHDDIKTAYREMAQILHPDKFASNKKLQKRATEQFKYLQEAYEYLTKGGGANESSENGATSSATHSNASAYSDKEARLAGIAAARVQLVAQKDYALDQRKNALVMLIVGIISIVLMRRYPLVIGLGSASVIWGIVEVVSSQKTITTIDEHLENLEREKNAINNG